MLRDISFYNRRRILVVYPMSSLYNAVFWLEGFLFRFSFFSFYFVCEIAPDVDLIILYKRGVLRFLSKFVKNTVIMGSRRNQVFTLLLSSLGILVSFLFRLQTPPLAASDHSSNLLLTIWYHSLLLTVIPMLTGPSWMIMELKWILYYYTRPFFVSLKETYVFFFLLALVFSYCVCARASPSKGVFRAWSSLL